jgi:perosamine synthetase
MSDRIPLSVPDFTGREGEYLQECIDSGWVAARGPFVERFESAFAAYHDAADAVSTASGTAALHLALVGLGIGPGDEVIVPALSFVATVNPVAYVGAKPVFADVNRDTYTIDPHQIESLITDRTRAIIVVHLYGQPTDMDAVAEVALARGIAIVEDATEALGASYRGRLCGTLGTVGCFSFNGNKVITSGGGGMLLASDPGLLERMRLLSLQGRVPGTTEWLHDDIGFNYVMSNLQAAVGLAQFEGLEARLRRKREIGARYQSQLGDMRGLEVLREPEWSVGNHWLNSVLIDPAYGSGRHALMAWLDAHGIDSRPFFYPLHQLKPYARNGQPDLPVAQLLHERGVSLPSSAGLTDADQERVIETIIACPGDRPVTG